MADPNNEDLVQTSHPLSPIGVFLFRLFYLFSFQINVAKLYREALTNLHGSRMVSFTFHVIGPNRINLSITKTRLYNVDPLKPHFYIIKLGFTGYTIFFLFLLKNIDCGYSLEPPRRGGSNEYPQSMF